MRSAGFFILLIAIHPSCIGIKYCKNITGHQPPAFTIDNFSGFLKMTPEEPLSLFDRKIAFISTGFKQFGISGWRDLHHHVKAAGRAVQSAFSTDRLLTIDMQIESLWIDEKQVPGAANRYIRVEWFISKGKSRPRLEKDSFIMAEGKLAWDGDGHFEIHPES